MDLKISKEQLKQTLRRERVRVYFEVEDEQLDVRLWEAILPVTLINGTRISGHGHRDKKGYYTDLELNSIELQAMPERTIITHIYYRDTNELIYSK
jgi:hypothetical protein